MRNLQMVTMSDHGASDGEAAVQAAFEEVPAVQAAGAENAEEAIGPAPRSPCKPRCGVVRSGGAVNDADDPRPMFHDVMTLLLNMMECRARCT